MCGITLNKTGMVSTRHRGLGTKVQPVGDGYFLIHDWLPIQTRIGVDPEQPIHLDDGSWMAFNGEIFDYPKEAFTSDTDYLVHLINAEGFKKAMIKLGSDHDGFWSIVVVSNEGRVAFATDPLGKKQLYIDGYDHEICSELRGLRPRRLNEEAILETIRMGYTDKPIFRGITKVIPGMVYEDFQPSVRIRPHPLKTDIQEAMHESVQNRLIGHEKIAAFVSGGLDSTIVAYHLSKLHPENKVKLYTISNTEDDQWIDQLQDFLKLPIHRMEVEYTDMNADAVISAALIANEVPFDLGSMIPQFLLFGSVQETVVLTGDGADELFGGYRRNQFFPTFQMDLHELIHYHLPRLDRMAGWHTKESRQPFLSKKLYAHALASQPRGKTELREAYRGILPDWVLDRPKHPLKSSLVRVNEKEHRYDLIQRFLKFHGYYNSYGV